MPQEQPPAPERTRSEHPTKEELYAFLLGRLDQEAAAAVLAHLVTECPACGAIMAPISQVMLHPRREPTFPSPFDGSKYDLPLGRFVAKLRRELHRRTAATRARPVPAAVLLEQLLPPRELGGEAAWEHCERLLEESWALRHEDPSGMVLLAAHAVAVAEQIDPELRGPRALADLQARAFAALGNARRVADDLWMAELDLAEARERYRRGTGDPLLLARLMELTASLYRHQRRFEESQKLLAWAYQVYERLGEPHLAGKTLLVRALSAGYDAEPEEAVALFTAALHRLDPARDPDALLACLHTLAWFHAECGRFEEAEEITWSARELYRTCGGELYDLKLVWLEGRIALGLGRPGKAERNFQKARQGFLARDLPYTAAIVALDLAALHLRRGRTGEARTVVSETIEAFDILGIHREAFMAVMLLVEALRQDCLSVGLLESAAAELQRIDR